MLKRLIMLMTAYYSPSSLASHHLISNITSITGLIYGGTKTCFTRHILASPVSAGATAVLEHWLHGALAGHINPLTPNNTKHSKILHFGSKYSASGASHQTSLATRNILQAHVSNSITCRVNVTMRSSVPEGAGGR